jgi:mono/diheme cytochrome c family protein
MAKFPSMIMLLLLAAFLSACSFSLAADITPPPGSELPAAPQSTQSVAASPVYPIVPPDLANGATIYNRECANCHGSKGMGDGPQAAQLSVPVATLGLSDFARLYTPAEWYTVVTKGDLAKSMPPFSNLTDRQRWDVVAYAISLSAPDELIAQGKSLYQEHCLNCHGLTGKGNGPGASTLSSQPKDFSDQAFMAQSSATNLYQSISFGIAPDMPAYSSTLDDNERWDLVGYLRSLTFAPPAPSGNTYPAPAVNAIVTPTSNPYPAPETYPNPVDTQSPALSTTPGVTQTVTFLGSVAVQLIKGSSGDIPSDVPVTLYGFDNMQNTYSETLSIGANGVYTFTNVLMPAGRVFLASAEYASGTYGSDIVTVDPAKPNLNLQVTIYDSTTDVSLLTTDRVHIFFDFSDPKNLQVIEVFIISNPSKQAVVAPTKDGTVVTFPLPQGYTNLQFQNGELGSRYVEVTQGFADKMTVNPGVGQYQVSFAFQMPYNRKLDFVQPMFLPTSAVVVLVPANGVKVDSSLLQDAGTRDFQGTTYHLYNGSSLIAGSSLVFTLSGTPKQAVTSIFTKGTMQNLAIGLGVFGLALVIGGVWLFRRNQSKVALQNVSESLDIAAPTSGSDLPTEDEDILMDAIIALDDQFHAGNLPEEAYLERRAVLKEKLRKYEQG